MVQFLEGRNRAWAQLDAPINGSDTNVALVAGQGSRLSDVTTASGRKVRAQIYERDAETGAITKCELVDITNNVSDVLIIERVVESTRATDTTNTYAATPQSFTANAIIEEVISSEVISEIQDEVNRLETDKLDKSTYDAERVVYAASSAGDDDYEILTGDSLATVADGRIFAVRADVPNNGASTLKVDATSPVALKKLSGGAFADLATGDIIANQIFFAMKNTAAACYQFSLDPATLSLTVSDADETTKGIAERDTDAEALGFTDTTRFTNAWQLGLATTLPEQILPYVVSSNTAYATNNPQIGCGITDTGVIFLSFYLSSTTTIQRYEKQARTGEYVCTHETTLTTAGGPSRSGLTVLGSYLYLCTYDAGAGAHVTRRYNIADLSGVTTITISGTIPSTNVGAAFNDGTFLYFPGASSQYYKYSISGTTITYVTSITYTTSGALWNGGAWSNGTDVWIVENVSATATIRKYALAGGAATATKDFIVYNNLGPNNGRFALFSGKYMTLGFGRFSTVESNSAVLGSVMKLSHVAQF